jgi:hypothetical protein
MLKSFSKQTTEYLSPIALFLGGLLVLSIRNPAYFSVQYCMQKMELGMFRFFSKRWCIHFSMPVPGTINLYWGDLILLWIAETSSNVLPGDSLVLIA